MANMYCKKGEWVLMDGETLDYRCKDCGREFGRLIGYGPICPNEWMRKEILEKDPTVCPECGLRCVERLRKGYELSELVLGRKLYEWE